MTWYVAHALMVLRPKMPIADPLYCWENLLLIEADENEDPYEIAERRGREENDHEFRMQPPYPVPSRWEFQGIRKMVEVRHDEREGELVSGDELTYNTLLFDNPAEIEKFLTGEECAVRYGNDSVRSESE